MLCDKHHTDMASPQCVFLYAPQGLFFLCNSWSKIHTHMASSQCVFFYAPEGYFFGWTWFKDTARFRNLDLWYFKPSRTTSRLLSHYLKADEKYQHIYQEWKK